MQEIDIVDIMIGRVFKSNVILAHELQAWQKVKELAQQSTNSRYATALDVLREYGAVEDVQYQEERTFQTWLEERLNPQKDADCT